MNSSVWYRRDRHPAVNAGAGDDNIDASNLVTTRADIHGDAGNDTIRGGAADDKLDGMELARSAMT